MHCLTFKGVDHAARPTWKLRDTVRFYRDLMGLSLVHAISARGWGTDTHPDFLHFFFDSGNGSSIAFFYYIGSKEPAALKAHQGTRPAPDDHVFDATHVSWLVDSRDDLHALRRRLEAHGIEVDYDVFENLRAPDPAKPHAVYHASDLDFRLKLGGDSMQCHIRLLHRRTIRRPGDHMHLMPGSPQGPRETEHISAHAAHPLLRRIFITDQANAHKRPFTHTPCKRPASSSNSFENSGTVKTNPNGETRIPNQ